MFLPLIAVVISALPAASLAASYCTGVSSLLQITDVVTNTSLADFESSIVFDSPRPNYSRYQVVNISKQVRSNEFSFGAFYYADVDGKQVVCSGVGCSGLAFNNYAGFYVNATYKRASEVLNVITSLSLYQGTIYGTSSIDFSSESPCEQIGFGEDNIAVSINICCNRWRAYSVQPAKKSCKTLQGSATFLTGSTVLATVNVTTSINGNIVSFSTPIVSAKNASLNLTAVTLTNSYQDLWWNEFLFNGGSQIYFSTRIVDASVGINLLSSLGYFEYHDGRITGFQGLGLNETSPCVKQTLPFIQLPNNTVRATSLSEICCTEFGDVFKKLDSKAVEILPLKFKKPSGLKIGDLQ